MRALRRFLARVSGSATRKRQEEQLKEEVEQYLALQAAENLRAGLSPVEARRQAMLKFGAMEAIKEDYRDVGGLPFIEALMQDTRHALRRLRKTPAFTLTAMLTLALGMERRRRFSLSSMPSCLNRCRCRIRISFIDWGKSLIAVCGAGTARIKSFSIVSYDLYKYLRDHTKGFEEMAGFQANGTLLGVRRVHKRRCGGELFR
jgi:hypothetical protein